MDERHDVQGGHPKGSRRKRIFWFGAHKVLKPTELRNLRELGFEVFNPPYISPKYDQSQDVRIDLDQPTTLPPEVFNELIRHDFFYTEVPPHIAELLNEYFDVAIVTINEEWLLSFLSSYRGRLIYRVYGQPMVLSDQLIRFGLWKSIIERDDFSIVPFAKESIAREHAWFLDRCVAIVPYQIPDDVFDLSGSWSGRRLEIATNIPNIQNPYYAAVYATFASRYRQSVFRIYGPQRAHPPDPRIVGSLERSDFLGRLAASAGYLYDYDNDVCYLSPIEAMELGGPVIYREGSLLSRFYGERTPGLIRDEFEAETKIRRLLEADLGFVREVIDAQEVVRRRYDRAIVRPLFDRTFRALLEDDQPQPAAFRFDGIVLSSVSDRTDDPEAVPSAALLLHADGWYAHETMGGVASLTREAEFARQVIPILCRVLERPLLVTCSTQQLTVLHELFFEDIKAGRIHLRGVRRSEDGGDGPRESLALVEALNRSVSHIVVPSLTEFPEALLLSGHVTVIASEETFPPRSVEGGRPWLDRKIADALIAKADYLLSTSRCALDDAGLGGDVAAGRAAIARAFASATSPSALAVDQSLGAVAQALGRRFVALDAEGWSDERLELAVKAFARVSIVHPDLLLVAICETVTGFRLRKVAEFQRISSKLFAVSRIAPATRAGLYGAAAVWIGLGTGGVALSRLGDALVAETPVVVARGTEIEREFDELTDALYFVRPSSIDDLAAGLELALHDPEEFREHQRPIREMLLRQASSEHLITVMTEAMGSGEVGVVS